MKLSVKFQDQHHHHHHHHRNNNPFLLRAKLPITVFSLPFLSVLSTSDPYSHLTFSLRTNFPSGPSLNLSYSPTPTSSASSPLSLTLKSGVSLFGSPTNSPLIISAHFTLSPPQNPSPSTSTIPTFFSLQIKPQFGDFSLRKTTYSSSPPPPHNPNPSPNFKPDTEVTSMGFVPLEKPPLAWKELSLDNGDSSSSKKDSLLSGITVTARTNLPVTNRLAVNCRWGVNFPADITKKMPFLTVNKIGIERVVDQVKEGKEVVEVRNGNICGVGDLELLKGLYLSVGRELEDLQTENREMKQSLEDMRFGKLRGQQGWSYEGYGDNGVAKKVPIGNANSGGFEQWKNKKAGGEEHGQKETKRNGNRAGDVESELERAIKAASSQ